MKDKKFVLPYGDALRDLLNDQGITKADLKLVLRRRGVFVGSDNRPSYVTMLCRTGLTPAELIEVQEKIRVKEENPKVQTQTVKWAGGEQSLLQSVPKSYDINKLISKPFSNYKVLGAPSFKAIDGNKDHVELSFTVERFDYTKSWDKNRSQFTGKVRFKKGDDNVDICINLSHTSPQTKEVANLIAKDIVNTFKNCGLVDRNTSIKTIKFNDFTNESRIQFLKELSQKQFDNELLFKDTKDIGFRPDTSKELPEDLSWMQEKITNLILQGKNLHSTFFIHNKSYHQYIQMHRVDADYSFDYKDYSGSCRISFDFPDLVAKENQSSELVIKVVNLRFSKKNVSISTSKLKEMLLVHLEPKKIELFEKYANK
ncbi:hypothetical protein OH456_06045 [Vibrio sp. La 4.2.2]|uniref:GapS4b family protein n=1 Tax=Vibrio sp. La 4.2.2 TaxID=2998830 RepID=UPI0022CE1029|nr:hypothetical protein [Vibrio sp. La 4.2.2]MDA0107696.1 hypothetical protein [Vibrio sp. La 4.2.2]